MTRFKSLAKKRFKYGFLLFFAKFAASVFLRCFCRMLLWYNLRHFINFKVFVLTCCPSKILTDCNASLHNWCFEFVRICGGLFLLKIDHKLLVRLRPGKFPAQGPTFLMFCSPSWFVITLTSGTTLHHAGTAVVLHQTVPGRLGKVALWGCLVLLLFMAVFFCEWAHSLGWEATPHMNGLRNALLLAWHWGDGSIGRFFFR